MFAANRAFPASSAGRRWLALGIVLMLRGRSGIPEAGRLVEIARPWRVRTASALRVQIPSVRDAHEDRSASFPSLRGHRAMTEQSTPACSNSMAALCRKTWGDTRFERRETQCSRALATYLFSSACTPSALSLPPCIFGKRAVAPRFPGSLSQRRRACCATFVSGVLRSLRPLPTHCTCAPWASRNPICRDSRQNTRCTY